MVCKYKFYEKYVYKFIFKLTNSNMYILIDVCKALIIDPCVDKDAFVLLAQHSVSDVTILLTHEHYDHISGVNEFKKRYKCHVISSAETAKGVECPKKNLAAYINCLVPQELLIGDWRASYAIDETYACAVDEAFEQSMDMQWCGLPLRLVHTPGHSVGSICILVNGDYIFTGDSLVDGKDIILRLPGGSKKQYKSITKPFLQQLPSDIIVFPGHGTEGAITQFNIV